jgi:parvulin-like peptidyl-prolyl isomerase
VSRKILGMNQCILFRFINLIALVSLGQQPSLNLKNVNTLEEAENFVNSNSPRHASIISLNSKDDTFSFERKLLSKPIGNIFTIHGYVYKVIDKKMEKLFRVKYIYINGDSISYDQVDSDRTVILSRYASGVSFDELNKEYNMDGNPNNGDTGEFGEKMMVKEFEDAVRAHKKDDVFKVDVPANHWFYVVKKTHADKIIKKITLIKMRNSS